MKKILTLATVSLFSLSINAQTEYNPSGVSESVIKRDGRPFEMSVGYFSQNIKNKYHEDAELKGNGVAIGAGRNFELANGFSTLSSLNASYWRGETIEYEIDDDSTTAAYELGLAQRLSYSIQSSGPTFKPFIEAGIARGNFFSTSRFSEESELVKIKADVDYNKFSAAVGFQVLFESGLAPFAKYSVSSMRFDKKGDLTVESGGQKHRETFEIEYGSERTYSSRTLILGLGYTF